MVTRSKMILLSVCFSVSLWGFLGCEQQGPAEKAGETIDETMEEAGETVEETGEEIADTAN
jgi:hypothetical protein